MNNVQGQAARKAHKAQHCWPPCKKNLTKKNKQTNIYTIEVVYQYWSCQLQRLQKKSTGRKFFQCSLAQTPASFCPKSCFLVISYCPRPSSIANLNLLASMTAKINTGVPNFVGCCPSPDPCQFLAQCASMMTGTVCFEEKTTICIGKFGDLICSRKCHIWNRRPWFAYSLCNFYGATMMIKGSLLLSAPIIVKLFLSKKMSRFGQKCDGFGR